MFADNRIGSQLQVTEADIEEFEANYRGSDSEKKDLIDLYKQFKGNMNRYEYEHWFSPHFPVGMPILWEFKF